MKTYKVKVNGKEYVVELEEVSAEETAARAAEAATQPTQGLETIESPMQGTIMAVKVRKNEVVKKNQVVVVLEAMKMENEIVAPADCSVVEILVKDGDTVENGAPLLRIVRR